MADDPIKRKLNQVLLPGRLSREAGQGAEKALRKQEHSASGELLFDLSFYRHAREEAGRWVQRAGSYTQAALLVPTGLFAASVGLGFPDKDISLLGIGHHRYFLFHSGLAVWGMRKLYEAYLNRSGEVANTGDLVVRRILGIAGAGAAFGVGVHLMIDVFQPKSIVFPFFGSLIEGTLIDDNLWLLGNSLWCFKMSHDFMALALGDDLPKVKAYVNETFVTPAKEGLVNAVSHRD